MTQHFQDRVALDELTRVSQRLKLACVRCGRRHKYDVGTVFLDQEGEGESAKHEYAFTRYFRCRDCGSAGPWTIADVLRMLRLALRSKLDSSFEGLVAGRCALFDGTFIQTPAMGEDYLLGLLEKDPRNAFLHTRLGNLFRGCGELPRAVEWYKKALALDPGDVEARYHLLCFAAEDSDVPAAREHAPALVRHLLEGRETDKDELTEGIAFSVVDTLRRSPPDFRGEFAGQTGAASEAPERMFIRTLLEQEGDEDQIVRDATERLLDGQPEPSNPADRRTGGNGTEIPVSSADSPLDLVRSLHDLVEAEALDPNLLSVAVETDDQGHIRVKNRHSVPVSDGKKVVFWPVASLRELFRGNRAPPADMDRYPPEYCGHFYFLERHLLTVCDAIGDRTDQELEEIYSALRRRPDGRILAPTHEILWQVAALALGMRVMSQMEFEAVVGQLERSARNWALRPVSRNYVEYLRSNFDRIGPPE